MHIHPNNNLTMATLGAIRNEVQEMQAKRAAEVRRKLAAPLSGLAGAGDGVSEVAGRSEEQQEDLQRQRSEADEEFGRLFSARA